MTLSDFSGFLNAIGFTQALLIAAFAYLCKTLIETWIKNGAENYKAQLDNKRVSFELDLKNTFDKQIESYKSGLEKERIRLQISYGGIFEKQAEAILELYNLTIALEESIENSIFDNSNGDGHQKYMEAYLAAHKFFEVNRIFLPPLTDSVYRELLNTTSSAVNNYKSSEHHLNRPNVPAELTKEMKALKLQAQEQFKKIPKIKEKLIFELRKLVGTFENNNT